LLGAAHLECQNKTVKAMKEGVEKICVANTFTTERELAPYLELGKKYGYRVFSIIVENRMGTKNVHDVPPEVLEKQKNRFNIKL